MANVKKNQKPAQKDKPAFRRVMVPENSTVIVVNPDQPLTENKELVALLMSMGYELTIVSIGTMEVARKPAEHVTRDIYESLLRFDPEDQNKMIGSLLAQLKQDRESDFDRASKNAQYNALALDVFNSITSGGNKADGIKRIN